MSIRRRLSRFKNPYNGNTTAVISMVGRGQGVTLLPTLVVRGEVRINNLHVRRFADNKAARTIGLVWRKKSLLTSALRKLATSMSQAYPKLQNLDLRGRSQ